MFCTSFERNQLGYDLVSIIRGGEPGRMKV